MLSCKSSSLPEVSLKRAVKLSKHSGWPPVLKNRPRLDQALLGELNTAKLKLFEKKEELEQAQYELLHRYALYQEATGGQWKWIGP